MRNAHFGLAAVAALASLNIVSSTSPHNRDRPARARTDYIVLHTTEAPGPSSLQKLRRFGEAHYLVDTDGTVHRIISPNRVAFHAGRSMWRGVTNLDRFTIGIEVVGYHDRPITAAQIRSLRELLNTLKRSYRVTDDRVLTHSMVAYGAPNRWHRQSHRGRKRCGMIFADPRLRAQLGLRGQPAHDPDVRAGRLVVADPYLFDRLFTAPRQAQARATPTPVSAAPPPAGAREVEIRPGLTAWDVAREFYNHPSTVYRFPDGTERRGDQITNWTALRPGTRVVLGAAEAEPENPAEGLRILGRDGDTPIALAGDEARSGTTLYLLADGQVKGGNELSDAEFARLPAGTGVLVGYVNGGAITARRSAFDICGIRWRFPSTYYRFPDGTLVPGHQVRETAIPRNSLVFYQP